jgi:hypothetical protein
MERTLNSASGATGLFPPGAPHREFPEGDPVERRGNVAVNDKGAVSELRPAGDDVVVGVQVRPVDGNVLGDVQGERYAARGALGLGQLDDPRDGEGGPGRGAGNGGPQGAAVGDGANNAWELQHELCKKLMLLFFLTACQGKHDGLVKARVRVFVSCTRSVACGERLPLGGFCVLYRLFLEVDSAAEPSPLIIRAKANCSL